MRDRAGNEQGETDECRLKGLPVFDGMAIANDSLFITLSDGKVICFR